MPNLYATPVELKAAMPDGLRTTTTKYDSFLLRTLDLVSRLIDLKCGRKFYPYYGVRYFQGSGTEKQRIDDAFSIVTVSYSDDGETFTDLTSSDWIGTTFEDENGQESYRMLVLPEWSSTLSSWPANRRGVKVTGWWAYVEDRGDCWENSGATLSAGYTASGTSLSVSSATITDRWGIGTAFQIGRLVKVDDEIFEITNLASETTPDTLTVIGGRNGTTAAAHSISDVLYTWRLPEAIKQAAIIQCVRNLERGLQGYGDARANPELGGMQWVRKMDPDVEAYLAPYVKRWWR